MAKSRPGAENKTELIAFRLTPRNRYGLELVCRVHGLTQTAAIAFALRQLIDNPKHGLARESGYVALKEIQAKTFSPDPAIRFINLAERYPELLNQAELTVWGKLKKPTARYRSKAGEWNVDEVRKLLDAEGS